MNIDSAPIQKWSETRIAYRMNRKFNLYCPAEKRDIALAPPPPPYYDTDKQSVAVSNKLKNSVKVAENKEEKDI